MPFEVVVSVDGTEQALPAGEQEVEIAGDRYLTEAIFARQVFDGPCTHDLRSIQGNAYVAPL